MSPILPRDILDKFEKRWTARVAQAEKFHVKADRLKQGAKPVLEGARPLASPEPPDDRMSPITLDTKKDPLS